MPETSPPSDPVVPSLADLPGAASSKNTSRWRRLLLGWPLRVALSLGLIVYLASNLDWPRVMQALLATNKSLVAAAFLTLALVPLLAAERWHHASLASRIRLPRRFFLHALYAALFAGQFLPSGIGVDAVRVALLWRQRIPLREGLQSVAIDRVAGVSAIVMIMYAGMPFALDLLPPGAAKPIAAMTVLMAAGCAVLLFVDRLPLPSLLRRGWAGRLLSLVADTRTAIGTPQALAALVFGIAIHLLSIFSVLLLAQAFGYSLRYRDLLTVTAIAVFAGMLPISFNGWGVREGAMMLGLSLLAVPRDIALMISFLYGVGGTLWSLPGSVSWYHLRHAQASGDQVKPQ